MGWTHIACVVAGWLVGSLLMAAWRKRRPHRRRERDFTFDEEQTLLWFFHGHCQGQRSIARGAGDVFLAEWWDEKMKSLERLIASRDATSAPAPPEAT